MNFDLVKFLLLPLRIFIALGLASGLIMFLPASITDTLCLGEFKQCWGQILGAIFILSLSMLIVFVGIIFLNWLKVKYDHWVLKRNQYNFLKRLDQIHVDFIKMFLSEPTHTISLPLHDGLVIEMTHHQIITPTSNSQLVDALDPQIYYFLQPWVIARIRECADLTNKYQISLPKKKI